MIALIGMALAASPSVFSPSETQLPSGPAVPVGAPAPIINGVIEASYPAAVGLGVGGLTVCSGSLITPQIVLTAAHCATDLPEALVTTIGVAFFGTVPLESETIHIGEVHVHPDYVKLNNAANTLGENDVAVIVLREPSDVQPVWFRVAPFEDGEAEGVTVRSVGWGLDENGDSYTKRSADLVIDRVDDFFLVSRARNNPELTSICSGDSGGPQYVVRSDGFLEQWSVHSWASSSCTAESGSTRTDVVADWVLEQVASVHGSSDRCEVWGQYDNGTCDEDCDAVDPDCEAGRGAGVNGLAAESGCATVNPPPVQVLMGGLRRR